MALYVQVLQDAEGVDHAPLMEFMQWARLRDRRWPLSRMDFVVTI